MGVYVEFEKWLCESEKKKNIIKKPLIREGPNSSSIPELIDYLTKNPDVSFVVIYLKFLGLKMAKSHSSV
jgi:hypothetical protein